MSTRKDQSSLARVISHFGHEVLICDAQGQTHRATVRKGVPALVSGDRVVCEKTKTEDLVITQRQPRQGLLSRSTRYSRSKPIAANIDLVLVVCSHQPELRTRLIDRYLAACELEQLSAVIVFNKIDQLSPQQLDDIQSQLAIYNQIGYSVFYISAEQPATLDSLRAFLAGKSSILVGQSGVGKSSIIRILQPEAEPRIGALSERSNKGQHTTTYSELYQLDEHSCIIDSPGIREFGLDLTEPDRLPAGFTEFNALSGECQFRDCRHLAEPGCAILEAVKQGRISEQRWQSYRAIYMSLNDG